MVIKTMMVMAIQAYQKDCTHLQSEKREDAEEFLLLPFLEYHMARRYSNIWSKRIH